MEQGQQKIMEYHRWSWILGVIFLCGMLMSAVLFRRLSIRKAWREKKRWTKRRGGTRKRAAFLITAGLLASGTFDDGTLIQARETEAPVPEITVSVIGAAGQNNCYQDTAEAVITFHERNFDPGQVSVTVQDETGRETQITYDTGREQWNGLDGLGAGVLAAVPYGTEGEKERWFYDSEEERTEHTQDREVEMRLRFQAERKYEMRKIVCGDLAGNQTVLENAAVIEVDRTDPEFMMVFPEEDESAVHEGYYSRPVTAWLYLKEHNFDPEEEAGWPQIIVSEEPRGEKASYTMGSRWTKAPEKGTDWYKASFCFAGDALYHLEASYQDPSGRNLTERSEKEKNFTVDTTPPEYGSITILRQTWTEFMDYVTFGLFSNEKELVLLDGRDSVSPIEPLQYLCAGEGLPREYLEQADDAAWDTGSSFFLTPDSRNVVYMKTTNYAGLSEYYSSNGILVEDKGPRLALNIQNKEEPVNGIYRRTVKVGISAEEPSESGIYSGLKRITYRMEGKSPGEEDQILEGVLMEEAEGNSSMRREWQGELEISPEKYDGRKVCLTVQAEDFAGNRSEESLWTAVDTSAPEISIQYNDVRPANEIYYNQIRTAVVSIRERNFSAEQVQFQISNTDGPMPAVSEWSHDGDLHRCHMEFTEDGEYTVLLGCEDMAGNVSWSKTEKFIIDRTPPEIFVTFEDIEAGRGKLWKNPRKAEITVVEHNFYREGVKGDVTAFLEGRQSRADLGEFIHNGDVHTAMCTFEKDGDYLLQVSCTDLAANDCGEENHILEEFTIDRTPPEILITGVADATGNRGTVAPAVTVRDIHLLKESVSVEIWREEGKQAEGERKRAAAEKKEEEMAAGERRFVFEDFSYDAETDGLYSLQVSCEDGAGNRTEKQIRFSVNRFGSVYVVDEGTAAWLYPASGSYPYLKEEKPVIVWEYNVDPVVSHQVILSCDGEVRSLLEKEDYTREEKEESEVAKEKPLGKEPGDQWRVYKYTIAKENFEAEGNYEVVLYSEDMAGNQMGNVLMKRMGGVGSIEFAIDKTGPDAVLSGAEDGGHYKMDELRLFLSVWDNMALKQVEIQSGDEKKIYVGNSLQDELRKNGGILAICLKEDDDWQYLSITAEDEAGNRMGTSKEGGGKEERIEWKLLVTSDPWIQLWRNPVRMAGYLAGTGTSAVFMAYFFRRRRRRLVKKGKR
ncbi:hypothetical protein [Qiania dongpingensis]|uniref:Ig-like domain-containing protein n=1 Tax=Qiania dongpingensis TaxID=2763669 RepID=A0A7G9G7J3_9FIRM|nr:hypothetical protein [Qiania dongpingensis]QNM06775.1 hypothetical protein H9Q78_06570 [Qiania dongpingensis]